MFEPKLAARPLGASFGRPEMQATQYRNVSLVFPGDRRPAEPPDLIGSDEHSVCLHCAATSTQKAVHLKRRLWRCFRPYGMTAREQTSSRKRRSRGCLDGD
ncbi:protein of unknown function [Methylocella tundrae]|uniref:Uncharacterized protein n=1 Tax=Methylocella tundrae TaxID=227605 RepID=A0A4U8YTJ2_METTU|nr:protein of unknown function [Methylocella tundrae]